MLTKTLAATAVLAVLIAGGQSLAAQKSAPTHAPSPKQPIPYSQLDAYAKASPKVRASKDWWAGQAQTGLSTDTSATAGPNAEPSTLAPATSASPASGDDANTAPSRSSSLPTTPPTNEPAIEEKTAPGAPGAPSVPPTHSPADPM